jgi:hypothetical protein
LRRSEIRRKREERELVRRLDAAVIEQAAREEGASEEENTQQSPVFWGGHLRANPAGSGNKQSISNDEEEAERYGEVGEEEAVEEEAGEEEAGEEEAGEEEGEEEGDDEEDDGADDGGDDPGEEGGGPGAAGSEADNGDDTDVAPDASGAEAPAAEGGAGEREAQPAPMQRFISGVMVRRSLNAYARQPSFSVAGAAQPAKKSRMLNSIKSFNNKPKTQALFFSITERAKKMLETLFGQRRTIADPNEDWIDAARWVYRVQGYDPDSAASDLSTEFRDLNGPRMLTAAQRQQAVEAI